MQGEKFLTLDNSKKITLRKKRRRKNEESFAIETNKAIRELDEMIASKKLGAKKKIKPKREVIANIRIFFGTDTTKQIMKIRIFLKSKNW